MVFKMGGKHMELILKNGPVQAVVTTKGAETRNSGPEEIRYYFRQ